MSPAPTVERGRAAAVLRHDSSLFCYTHVWLIPHILSHLFSFFSPVVIRTSAHVPETPFPSPHAHLFQLAHAKSGAGVKPPPVSDLLTAAVDPVPFRSLSFCPTIPTQLTCRSATACTSSLFGPPPSTAYNAPQPPSSLEHTSAHHTSRQTCCRYIFSRAILSTGTDMSRGRRV